VGAETKIPAESDSSEGENEENLLTREKKGEDIIERKPVLSYEDGEGGKNLKERPLKGGRERSTTIILTSRRRLNKCSTKGKERRVQLLENEKRKSLPSEKRELRNFGGVQPRDAFQGGKGVIILFKEKPNPSILRGSVTSAGSEMSGGGEGGKKLFYFSEEVICQKGKKKQHPF